MTQAARPGDVLAGRYLLVDLLSESGHGRFWRAHDNVLDRHVALHCIAADDDRADGLMDAARLSATVLDRRLLRVLDADERDGTAYVVNEWGVGTSLDVLVANEGPLPPRRAAWVVSEVAACVALAHEQRIAHGRLVPENVLIDQSGSIRVIGCCVDAAHHGLPPGRISTDVTDLGGLLYATLTGKWAGSSRSQVTPAPQLQGRWLRPRQVRAGIPRVLDAICDQVLNPFAAAPSGSDHNLHTAAGLAAALRDYVGDPTGFADPVAGVTAAGVLAVPERRTPHPAATPDPETTRALPLPGPEPPEAAAASPATLRETEPAGPPATLRETEPAGPQPAAEAEGAATSGDQADDETGDQARAHLAPDDDSTLAVPVPPPGGEAERGARPPVEHPTEAGMPIFDDEGDDVTWFKARHQPPPPPPPLEEPPERPLFAPAPADGGPTRRPRPGAAADQPDYWPWDTGTGAGNGSGVIPVTEDPDRDDGVPGRSWFRLAAIIGASLLLLVGVVIAFNLGRGKSPLGTEPDSPETSTSPSESADPPQELQPAGARDLDPQGGPEFEENRDLAPLVVDGDPGTAWQTVEYNDQLGPPPGLKTGVGVVVDLGESTEVAEVEVTTVGRPTDISYYLTDQDPKGVAELEPVAQVTVEQQRLRTTLDEPAAGRYLVVWLTELPPTTAGTFQGSVAEVVVRG